MTTKCARCERPADPDTECVVVILGVEMCAACASDWQTRRDAEDADALDRAAAERLAEGEGEIFR